MLDGQEVLFLEGIDGFSAQRRADLAGSLLAEAVQQTSVDAPPLWVQISQRDRLVTLRLRGRHLLTVTDADAVMGVRNRKQAEIWAGSLEPRHQLQVRSDLYYLLEANLRRYDIEIPFPQRDIRLRWSKTGPEGPLPQLDDIRAAAQKDYSLHDRDASLDDAIPTDLLADLSDLADCTLLIQQQESLSESELRELSRGMHGVVERRDRRYRLRLYRNCFVGSEAVTWLAQTQKTTREQAVTIGQQLVENCIIHPIADEHPFMDDYFFYRFYEDSRNEPQRKSQIKS